MRPDLRCFSLAAVTLLAGCAAVPFAPPASAGRATTSSSLIPIDVPIDESQTVLLAGNVHPLARPEFDQGPLAASTPLGRMLLVLKATPAQQSALDTLVQAQQNPVSPLYHHWLTPTQFGAEFGAAPGQISQIAAWLAANGFTIEGIPAGKRLIAFSGTAGQVDETFHTQMHRYLVPGADQVSSGHIANAHIANDRDPQIPAAFAGVVGGIVSLHDFRRSPSLALRPQPATTPQYSAGGTHYLAPADFATIYDLSPLYNAGDSGAGAAIAIAGRSNIDLADVAQFRSTAGLAANPPAVVLAGADPGLAGANLTGIDQAEATLDVEWSGAIAPAASVTLVAAASTATTDGVDLASAYIVNHATAPILSASFATCEPQMGATELAFYNALWEQAAAEGISVFVASGDAGAAGCSAGADATGSQQAVNGLCSSPFATCVGGTEFNEGADSSAYWAAGNGDGLGSALQYIPEQVWNESAANGGADMWASGGGASIVYAQPSWQAAVPGAAAAGGMRAVPDVALSAADHDGVIMVENGGFYIASGTSVTAPSFAGIMALVAAGQTGNEASKGQGSANPRLYALAGSASAAFHSTPSGTNTVPGVAGYAAGGTVYNLATGLGSVDGAQLVSQWAAKIAQAPPSCPLRLVRARCHAGAPPWMRLP